MSKNISIHYAEHESGWAEPLGDGTYRICNIPLCSNLNIADIVTLKPGDPACCERPVIDRVVRGTYAHKVIVHYLPLDRAAYRDIWQAVDALGGKSEGYALGTMAVAVHDRTLLQTALELLPLEIDTPVKGVWIAQPLEEGT